MLNKAASIVLLLGVSLAGASVMARADDSVTVRKNVEKYEKDMARDQQKLSLIQSDIKTQQAVITQDIAKYGADSSEVSRDRGRLTSLRKTLADRQGDLQKDSLKKQAQAGQVPPADLHQ